MAAASSLVKYRASRHDRTEQLEEALRIAANALAVARKALEGADVGQLWLNAPRKPETTPLTVVSHALRAVKHRAPDLVKY